MCRILCWPTFLILCVTDTRKYIAYIHVYLRVYACVYWAADDLNRAVLVEKHTISVIQEADYM